MKLNSLVKTTKKESRRLGQGHGSGRVKTSGRGTKGQNARSKRPLSFEGGALPLIKRLPFARGKGRNKSFKKKPVLVSLEKLGKFPKGAVVDIKSLIEHGILKKEDASRAVKILANGQIKIPLNIKLPFSKGAAIKIEKAGGSVDRQLSV